MAKFLLFLAVIAAIYFIVRASNRRTKPPPATPDPDRMVSCARCGLYFPGKEAVRADGKDYCCEDHRRLGAGP